MTSTPAVVIDVGSGLCKAGFAGEDGPISVFPSIIGRPKNPQMMVGVRKPEYFVGHAAQQMRGVLTLQYPVENGVIKNWDDIERIWYHTFYNELRVHPEDQACLLTEAPRNPKSNRERMCEMMFERFNIPGLYIAIQAVMSLYSSGKTTGAVLDIGDGATHIVPIFEGHGLNHLILRLNFAGRDITDYLNKLLLKRGYSMVSSAELEVVRDIKEHLCYVAVDPEEEFKRAQVDPSMEKHYEMPDGQLIHVSTERFQSPEILFSPQLIGREIYGIHEALHHVIEGCEIDLRRTMYKNVVLSGGSTMFEGLIERLQNEVNHLAAKNVKVKVNGLEKRNYAAWIGASILGSLNAFREMIITKGEYEEMGPRIVHRKCF
ncbi:Actin, cytoplasmic [Echinococcus granulosus]|uniref:Actin n=1 Tax=Echinococcus granulosus TaxID=6210 RepID=U6JJP6_ECHGR|nr:Actin, cytoplasmic [Echinococcus granulosus]EUB58199.1 Actin, cytoplasmic [Echinococcus granulosus]KAH9283389.1 Actin, cytoplasmic [Echinococcus granulosus]CDS24317.1 actin [Echinococcus granulosus]